jgi:O-antigen/teichoic acid export membrane protein
VSKEKAAAAGLWSGADILLRQGVQFVVALTLTRLLSPSDFGVMALLTLFSSLSMAFVDSGMSVALIRQQTSTRGEETSVFWFNLAVGLLCAGGLSLAAPYVARFYRQPVLRPLMAVAAAQVVIGSLGAVQSALLTRGLRFRQLLIVGALATSVSGALGVGLALAGFGVWSLAWQILAMSATTTSCLWFVGGWRPSLSFEFAHVRALFRFSGSLLVSSLLDLSYNQGFSAIVGKLYGVGDLGFYNRGSSVQGVASGMLSTLVGRVTLPLFSARADDPAALRRGVSLALRTAMAINVPAMIGLAVLADLVVVALFGERWRPSGPILSVLALSGLLWPVHVINLQAVLARGDSPSFLRLTIAKQSTGLVTTVVGSFFGIMGLAWSQVVYGVIAALINAAPSRRFFDYGIGAQLAELSGLFAIGALMGATLLLARSVVALSPPVELATLIALGALVYIGAGLALRVAIFTELKEMLCNIAFARKRQESKRG